MYVFNEYCNWSEINFRIKLKFGAFQFARYHQGKQRSLQKDFSGGRKGGGLGTLPLVFKGVKRIAMEKQKNKGINPLFDVPVWDSHI